MGRRLTADEVTGVIGLGHGRNPAPSSCISRGMIRGAHIVVYSRNPDADRDFFRDTLKYPFVDAGQGWLIFALPPAELAIHPSDESDRHELYFMCDDIHGFAASMQTAGFACSAVEQQRWGSLVRVALPGGGSIGVYQPTHPSPVLTPAPPARP